MGRRPKWICNTVVELRHEITADEMSQRLDEVTEILVECLRQLRSSKPIPHEVLISDPDRDISRDRTGSDG